MVQLFLMFGDWALFALRIILGIILLVHGLPKIRDLKGTAKSFKKMGFRPGFLWGRIVAVLEFGGGILLILGFFSQIISLILFIQFLVILIVVKKNARFKGEVEFDLLILAGLLVLATMGGGVLSLDKCLGLLIY